MYIKHVYSPILIWQTKKTAKIQKLKIKSKTKLNFLPYFTSPKQVTCTVVIPNPWQLKEAENYKINTYFNMKQLTNASFKHVFQVSFCKEMCLSTVLNSPCVWFNVYFLRCNKYLK